MKSSTGKILSNAAAIFAAFLLLMPMLIGQTSVTDSPVQIQKADYRGQRPHGAIMAAVSASRQDVVVIILRGGNDELIAETEGNLKGLIQNNYTRLGFILSDLFADEIAPVIAIYSNGLVYAVVHDAKADVKTSSDVYKLVRDAYQEDILSKLKPKAEPAKGGL